MSGTTTLGFPYPELTDDPNGAAQIQALAEAVDAQLSTPNTTPIGDSSNSVYLTGSDIGFGSGDDKTIVSTFAAGGLALTRNQWVLIAGKAAVINQTSNASGLFGIYIDVDGVDVPGATSGNMWVGPSGSINERQMVYIPTFSVFLAAGTHQIRLRGVRDNVGSTHNAQALETQQGHTLHPCSLTIIV